MTGGGGGGGSGTGVVSGSETAIGVSATAGCGFSVRGHRITAAIAAMRTTAMTQGSLFIHSFLRENGGCLSILEWDRGAEGCSPVFDGIKGSGRSVTGIKETVLPFG
jgi:hypothetical protein